MAKALHRALCTPPPLQTRETSCNACTTHSTLSLPVLQHPLEVLLDLIRPQPRLRCEKNALEWKRAGESKQFLGSWLRVALQRL